MILIAFIILKYKNWRLGFSASLNLYCIFILLLLSICFLPNFYYVKCKGNLHDIAHFFILLKVIFDETLQQFLDSYLQFAPRYWKDLFHWTVFVVGCGKETFTYLLCGGPNIVLSPRKFEIRSCVLVQSLRNQSIIVLCTWVWFQTVCFNKFFSSLGTLMHQFFHQN